MITADYQCGHCDRLFELDINYVAQTMNACQRKDCIGEIERMWTPVSIGKVPGAGGSPAR